MCATHHYTGTYQDFLCVSQAIVLLDLAKSGSLPLWPTILWGDYDLAQYVLRTIVEVLPTSAVAAESAALEKVAGEIHDELCGMEIGGPARSLRDPLLNTLQVLGELLHTLQTVVGLLRVKDPQDPQREERSEIEK